MILMCNAFEVLFNCLYAVCFDISVVHPYLQLLTVAKTTNQGIGICLQSFIIAVEAGPHSIVKAFPEAFQQPTCVGSHRVHSDIYSRSVIWEPVLT